MRNVATVLGLVVAGATISACGGAVEKGTLGPNGQKSTTSKVEKEDACGVWEEWSYTIEASVACEQARSYLESCSSVCGESGASCGGTDGAGRAVLIAGGEAAPPCSTPTAGRPTEIWCRKTIEQKSCVMEGRRPDGLHAVQVDAYASVAHYFANAAHLEAAAVLAFERLERELREEGAPPALIGRLRRATREERRHVEITSELARSFGAEPLPATAEPFTPRSLFEIARENVVEGVVRETYGAAVALFRAERASTPELRSALSEIAHDECRHAQLSWDMHAWMWSWLREHEREQIDAARLAAIEELREALRAEPAAELVEIVGVPRAAEAAELFDGLFAHAWKTAA
ncbi:MAG: ferritin-like domain-containing protein [Deltaproteobacteria bacterium]|nr:ferritin-like domain-containing protein [Deltaproteobacteria bacterium]